MVVATTASYPGQQQIAGVFDEAVREARFIDASALARGQLGDEQYANMIMVGAAYQSGALPLGADAIEQAIRLNGTAVAANLAAFRHGRQAAAGVARERTESAGPGDEPGLGDFRELVSQRSADLMAYQNASYAARYTSFVARVRAAEAGIDPSLPLSTAIARNLYKLMAYKDEYEVARLSLDPQLTAAIGEQFGPGARYRYRLHPPVLRALGMKRKISLGPAFRPVFQLLAAGRRLRGTPFDPFGRTRVRRTERSLITEYRGVAEVLRSGLTAGNHALAVEIAALPDLVRGYEEIKLRNVATYRDRTAELLARFTASPATALDEVAAD